MLLPLCFLTNQLEHHNAGGCTDNDFTLPDVTVKAIGKGNLLTTICVARDLVYLRTQSRVPMQSKNTPMTSKQVPQT